MGFTKKTLHCLGCKAKIASGTVCGHCKPREGEVYLKRVHECIEHERTFNELWTQCQRCQGSLHQDVLCSNSDCPIFYKRKKVQADLRDSSSHLQRFDVDFPACSCLGGRNLGAVLFSVCVAATTSSPRVLPGPLSNCGPIRIKSIPARDIYKHISISQRFFFSIPIYI